MRYRAFAADGDGTLTWKGRMAEKTTQALQRVRAFGRTLFLITGERLQELTHFPNLDLFDCVVAENGGLLYWPREGREKTLGPPPIAHELDKPLAKGTRPSRSVFSPRAPPIS